MNQHDNNHHAGTVAAHLDGATIAALTGHAETGGETVHQLAARILTEWAGVEAAKEAHPSCTAAIPGAQYFDVSKMTLDSATTGPYNVGTFRFRVVAATGSGSAQ